MRLASLTAAAFLAGTGAAHAVVTFDISAQGLADAQAVESNFLSGLNSIVTEDFEGFSAAASQVASPLNTAVGQFRATGDPGTGNCIGSCTDLAILDSGTTPFGGRVNTTGGGTNWLDSNDVSEVTWDLGGGIAPTANAFGLFVSDANDVDASLEITTAGGTYSVALPNGGGTAPNGDVYYVSALSTTTINAASVVFDNDGSTNDGFGIDDVSVAVPEPATLGLLGAGLAGIGLAARRRRT